MKPSEARDSAVVLYDLPDSLDGLLGDARGAELAYHDLFQASLGERLDLLLELLDPTYCGDLVRHIVGDALCQSHQLRSVGLEREQRLILVEVLGGEHSHALEHGLLYHEAHL